MDGVVTKPEHGPTRVVLSANVIDDQRAKDCSYVAALHPAAILSLLDELQTLREERTAWRVTAENAEAELSAIKASLGEPVYQLKLSDGTWIDQTADSYRYNQKEFSKDTRILYALTNKDRS